MSDKLRQWFLEHGYDSNYRAESLGGGCINAVSRIVLRDGQTFILKQNQQADAQLFPAEATGLTALRGADALRVPEVICAASEFLLLEDLGHSRPNKEYWERLGMGMAKLHSHQQSLFGFTMDNYCGSTAQINTRTADGFDFFANNRIRRLAVLGLQQQLLTNDDMNALEYIAANLSRWIPVQAAVLLHGDLWSGNIHCDENGIAALIDPATHYGWAEAELAMTELFAGFNQGFYDSYAAHSTMDSNWRERAPLYNLYHLLNHLLLFGAGYLPQIRRVIALFGKK